MAQFEKNGLVVKADSPRQKVTLRAQGFREVKPERKADKPAEKPEDKPKK